jgi:hypothetical protein
MRPKVRSWPLTSLSLSSVDVKNEWRYIWTASARLYPRQDQGSKDFWVFWIAWELSRNECVLGVIIRCFLLRTWLPTYVCSISALHNATTPVGLLQQSSTPKQHTHFLAVYRRTRFSLNFPIYLVKSISTCLHWQIFQTSSTLPHGLVACWLRVVFCPAFSSTGTGQTWQIYSCHVQLVLYAYGTVIIAMSC